jgi:hypothetical protein
MYINELNSIENKNTRALDLDPQSAELRKLSNLKQGVLWPELDTIKINWLARFQLLVTEICQNY